MTASPTQIAAAWRAFRGDRPGTLLGPGPGFREAIDAALAVGEAKRAAAAAEGWEMFRDPAYFDMWCVRPKGEREFGRGFHVATEQEATALATTLDAVRRLAGVTDGR